MLEPSHSITELLSQDKRYKFDAYVFVFEALSFAQNVLEMGHDSPSEPLVQEEEDESAQSQRHVTGQELCEAIRRYALQQYGYMAKTVLNSWGIRRTGDFGEIVFNLIGIGHMRKTPNDRREDFEDVYDFDTAFQQEFRIRPAE